MGSSTGVSVQPGTSVQSSERELGGYLIGLHSKEGRDALVSEKLVITPQARGRCKRKKLSRGATPTL